MPVKKIAPPLFFAFNGGLLAGMILIAFVLVPFWQDLAAEEPQAFLDWFAEYAPIIGSIMLPLAAGSFFSVALSVYAHPGQRTIWIIALVFLLASILYFPLYFKDTNASMVEQTLDLAEVADTLATWQAMHWQRLVCAAVSLAAGIVANARARV